MKFMESLGDHQVFNTSRIDDIYQDINEKNKRLILHYGDLVDTSNMLKKLLEIDPMRFII